MGRLVGLDLSKVTVDGKQLAEAPVEVTMTEAPEEVVEEPVEEVVEEAEKPVKKAKKNDK